jgi:DNA-binding protein H-NS
LTAEIERRRRKKETDFLAQFREQAKALGIPLERLIAALGRKSGARARADAVDGRSTVARPFRNPENHAQTWAGHGKPPLWIALGSELNPRTGKSLPLRKFWVSEQEKPQA